MSEGVVFRVNRRNRNNKWGNHKMALNETDTHNVGYELIDNDHDAFINLLNELDSADNANFPALFQQLYEHTEQHFDHENQLMKQSSYPGETEHKGEHQRVLGEFKQFKSRVDKGMIVFGRSFVKDRLPQWFGLHVTTMDSALTAHIKAQLQA
jgi:hemerythrin-like metal-binding protein